MNRLACLLLSAAAALITSAAWAEDFPSGPVNIVVPLAPGDAADTTSRLLADEMGKVLKTNVVIVNRPGAGGALGALNVVHAHKDGQTILFAQNSALTIRAVLDPQVAAYDATRDLQPLGTSSRSPSVLAVRRDAPFKTLAELIDYAKKNPDQVHIGHPGVGSVGDFCIQLINTLAGTRIVGVPFTGATPSITALQGETIDGVVLAEGALGAHLKAGTLRGLVASGRNPEFPQIPTMGELGYREELFGVWFSFHAPAGIPEGARKALVAAIEQAVKSPAIAARLAPLGIVQSYATPEATAAEMRDELRRVTDLAKRTGLIK
jgi:tripartite-type tricarboxylate transporter receptor subunit TctC